MPDMISLKPGHEPPGWAYREVLGNVDGYDNAHDGTALYISHPSAQPDRHSVEIYRYRNNPLKKKDPALEPIGYHLRREYPTWEKAERFAVRWMERHPRGLDGVPQNWDA